MFRLCSSSSLVSVFSSGLDGVSVSLFSSGFVSIFFSSVFSAFPSFFSSDDVVVSSVGLNLMIFLISSLSFWDCCISFLLLLLLVGLEVIFFSSESSGFLSSSVFSSFLGSTESSFPSFNFIHTPPMFWTLVCFLSQ